LVQVYDQTVYIEDALALVYANIWQGGLLAMAVLLLFLRSARSLFIIGLAIPISIVGAAVAMVALGRTVNVISLAGMAFAVGMVVDNAIVVLENIFQHLERGKRPLQAAYDATREVWLAVLASTLTTVVVFIPILSVEEEAGQLFRDISLAICATVAISLLVAITVVPCASAYWLRAKDVERELHPEERRAGLLHAVLAPLRWLAWPFRQFPRALGASIHALTGSVLARLAIIAGFTVVSVVGTIELVPPSDYLPTGNRNLMLGLMIPPPGYNLAQEEALADRVEAVVAPYFRAGREKDPAAYERAKGALEPVPTFDLRTMSPGPAVVPPPLENYFLVSLDGTLFQGGVSREPERAVDMQPLFQHASRAEIAPGVLGFAFQVPLFRLGGRTGSAVKIDVRGLDLASVASGAGALYQRLVQLFGPFSIQPEPSNFNLPSPELEVRPDDLRLAEAGLSAADLALAVQASGDGAVVGEYLLGGETIDLSLIADAASRTQDPTALGETPIATAAGEIAPLSSLATLRRISGPPQINRVARQRAVTLQLTPPRGIPLQAALQQIEASIGELRASGAIPAGVEVGTTGSASKLESVQRALLGDGSFLGTLGSSLFLALLVVYLVMCVLFQSFLYPLVILFSVPLATFGGFLALHFVHLWSESDRYLPVQTLDVLTMLGFVILIGVVVNNAILLVDQSLRNLRGNDGPPLPMREAIAEAVRSRVRPIFMSSFTSIGGLLPLVLMPGSGSELYRGLGAVVLGGLLVSTIFTLVLVPLLLSFVIGVRERWVGRRSEEELAALGAEAA
ncbi:MAG: efflux RND transporter permease subunit, partial [Planctomycetes bacterium]|nr:efflux RND transporter permease subunit [Planctomycetota bacterium]